MVIDPGCVVYSLAGRDKDSYFIVLSRLDDKTLLIADGSARKVDMPKRKNIKHLKIIDTKLRIVSEKLQSGQTLTNKLLRRELKAFIAEL